MHGLRLYGGHAGYLVGWSSAALVNVEQHVVQIVEMPAPIKIERRGRKRKRARKL